MPKVILKTALITLASIVAAGIITYLCLLAFSPLTLANFYSNVGNEKLALSFNERVYKNHKNQENLKRVIASSIASSNDEKTIEYVKIFLENQENIEDINEYYYFAGEMCLAILNKDGIDNALLAAVKYVKGYGKLNPLETLIFHGVNSNNKELISKLKTTLNDFKNENYGNLSSENKKLLDEDIDKINKLSAVMK